MGSRLGRRVDQVTGHVFASSARAAWHAAAVCLCCGPSESRPAFDRARPSQNASSIGQSSNRPRNARFDGKMGIYGSLWWVLCDNVAV